MLFVFTCGFGSDVWPPAEFGQGQNSWLIDAAGSGRSRLQRGQSFQIRIYGLRNCHSVLTAAIWDSASKDFVPILTNK